MVTTRRAGQRARGASRGGPGGAGPPREDAVLNSRNHDASVAARVLSASRRPPPSSSRAAPAACS
eukprot:8631355-Alexandrium_andersonii.AAC.1